MVKVTKISWNKDTMEMGTQAFISRYRAFTLVAISQNVRAEA